MVNKLEVVKSADEVEHADLMVCAPLTDPLHFPDNQTGECSRCSKPIQFRPHGPVVPKKICLPCALPDILREEKAGTLTVSITEKTRQEVLEVLNAQKKVN